MWQSNSLNIFTGNNLKNAFLSTFEFFNIVHNKQKIILCIDNKYLLLKFFAGKYCFRNELSSVHQTSLKIPIGLLETKKSTYQNLTIL